MKNLFLLRHCEAYHFEENKSDHEKQLNENGRKCARLLKNWFEKLVMAKVQKFFGTKCKMLFATYLNEEDPFDIHSDYFHKRIGEPFITFLIPLGVNGAVNKISLAKTIIFNQLDTGLDNDVHTKKSYDNNFRKLFISKLIKLFVVLTAPL